MPAVSPRAAAAAPADISTAPASAPPLTLLPVDYLQRISARPQPSAGYQLIDEIGRGGMGIVYLARARSTNGSWR